MPLSGDNSTYTRQWTWADYADAGVTAVLRTDHDTHDQDFADAINYLAGVVADLEGGVGGSTGSTDNALVRADGTGGATLQSTGITVNDSDVMAGVAGMTGTGTWDLGGADDLEIPNGTAPTVDTAGQIALDTNGVSPVSAHGVLLGHDGTQVVYFWPTVGVPSSDNDVPAYDSATNAIVWQAQAGGGGGGGSAITLDLGDDGGDDSTDLSEIAITNDTNSIFTEPSADKLLIDVSANWPTADVIASQGALATLDTVDTAQIDDEAVTLAKMAHMATASLLGRSTASTGDVEVLSASTARTLLNVEDGATADQTAQEIATAIDADGTAESTLVSALDIATLTVLASTSNGDGAALIGIEDSGTLITATTVEGALAENRTAIDALEALMPSGDVVGTSDSQTLTNKTLTSPVINVGSDAEGDIYYRNSGGAFTRLAAGSDDEVLTLASGVPSWAAQAGGGDVSAAATFDTDNVIIRSDGTSKGVQFSGVAIDDSDNVTGVTSLGVDTYIDITPASAPSHSEGRLFYDSTAKTLSYYGDESDITMNLGREDWIRVYNDTGSTISNGEAVYVSGYDASNDLPEVDLCTTDDSDKARFAGLATHDIENASIGYVTNFGRVNGLDTSAFTAGVALYLDPATPGGLTETRPSAPNYIVPVAVTVRSHASLGAVLVGATAIHGGNSRISEQFWNGSIVEDIDVDVSSNGSTITLTVEASGGGDLTLLMGQTRQTLDCTPAASVTLTAGSDTAPQINYVYVPASTDTLTASTSGWPAAEHVPIATVLCQSASSLQTQNAYKLHVWNDHLSGSDDQGHLSHINRWIRSQDATWTSGVAVTPTAGASTLDIATSAGVILQLHDHTFPAFDTSSGDVIYVVNDPDAAYTPVASLTQADGVDKDANGDTLGGGGSDFYNLVLWGVVNEDADDCKLMCNLPDGSYGNDNGNQASNDDANTAVYTIPTEFRGVGFLIARLTISESGGTYSVENTVDLRGQTPGLTGAVGAAGSNEFPDSVFRLQDEGDNTKELAFQLSGITTATTRTLTVPDASGTIMLTSAIGSTVQAYDADLDTWAGLTPSANAQSLVTAANYAAMRTLLDLEPGTDFYAISAADTAIEVSSVNAETGTTLTLALTDRGQTVTLSHATGCTVTIPTNASVAFDTGTVINIVGIGAGTYTIAGDTGVTLNGVSAGSGDINNQYQGVSLLKTATNTWIASGDIGTVA